LIILKTANHRFLLQKQKPSDYKIQQKLMLVQQKAHLKIVRDILQVIPARVQAQRALITIQEIAQRVGKLQPFQMEKRIQRGIAEEVMEHQEIVLQVQLTALLHGVIQVSQE
jgi:hypothetical protein